MTEPILPLTGAQATILRDMSQSGTAIFHRKSTNTNSVRRRGKGFVRQVYPKDLDAMIHHGYIGRQDQRAVWFITERGKIALEEYIDG